MNEIGKGMDRDELDALLNDLKFTQCEIDESCSDEVDYFIKPKHDSNEAYRRLMVVRDTLESFQRDINDAGVYSIPKGLIPMYEKVKSLLQEIEEAELEIIDMGE